MSAIKEYYHDQIEAAMRPGNLSNKGNVDDIRCSLNNNVKATYSIKELTMEIEYERQHKNRITVIKLLELEIGKLQSNNNE